MIKWGQLQQRTIEMGDYTEWHLPLHEDTRTVRDVLTEFQQFGNIKIPTIIQLTENPKYKWFNDKLFPGAVTLSHHDVVHILLARGMLPKDEAFVIGYTMGSTKRLKPWQTKLYCMVAKFLYPNVYRFNDDDIVVFNNAVKVGAVCVSDMSQIPTSTILDMSIRDARTYVGIDVGLLHGVYQHEKSKFPNSTESIRCAAHPCRG